jgi:hypothetical protein
MITVDEDGIPLGWEMVTLTDSERDQLVEAADVGDIETADAVVEQAYARLFGEFVN